MALYQLISDAEAYFMQDQVKDLPQVKVDIVFQNLCTLLNELGLPLNMSKLTPPTKNVTYLGIDIDVNNSSRCIPQAKLHEIQEECMKVSFKKYSAKRSYQSLTGKLLYIQKCVHSARVFINHILALF